MATRLCEVLVLLLEFRYQIALYLCCNLVALLIFRLFCVHMDPLPHQEESDTAVEAEIAQRNPENSSAPPSCHSPQERLSFQDTISGDQTPTLSQARLRSFQPKVSFLDLRLTDTSNRSLQDSIWATPTPSIDKTPTRNTYIRKKSQEVRAEHTQSSSIVNLSSNRAERYPEESTLQDKMKAFERKNMGTLPWFDGAFQPPKDGRSRLRRHRSYPRLRHSVLTWWAGVEQENASGAPPREADQVSEFEEHSDCSVCEVVQPWDSWSAAMHNRRVANDQNGKLKTRRIFTNFDPATVAPSTSLAN
ncbi:hypothetical protein AX14_007411 [Amanita brunnescens Koide BX004]|nr:hypothetical protein AX14_007411 [Amanita brunnescens Koide BX004]